MAPPPIKKTGSAEVKVDTPPPPAKPEEAKKADVVTDANDPANQPKSVVVKGSLGIASGTNGYNDSYLFPGSFGKFGDHMLTHVDVAAGHDLTGGKLRFRVMGQLNGDFWRGDASTRDGSLNLISIGPRLELDWRRAIPWQNFGLFSRVGIDLGLGIGWGTAPFETITPHTQPATFGMSAGVDLNVVNFQIPGLESLEWGLDGFYRTTVIDGPVANSAGNFVGGMLTLRPGVVRKADPVKVPEPVIVCKSTAELIEKLRKDIHGDGEKPGLAAEVKRYEGLVTEKRELLKTRTIDPLDDAGVLTVLRDQRAAELSQKQLVGLDPKKDEEKIKKIKAEAAVKAEADFPSVEKFWDPTPASKTDKELEIPNPLPKDCEELDKLFKLVDKNKDDLQSRLEQLKKVYDAPFPPRIREKITEFKKVVEPNFKKIHFEDSKPDENKWAQGNLDKALDALKKAKRDTNNKIIWNDPDLVKALKPIFDGPKTGTQYTNEVIKIIEDTSTALNQDVMKEITGIEIQGHTSLKGNDAYNQKLSERRAKLIVEMLVAAGVASSRLTPKGYGETKPIRADEESLPKNSADRASAEAENRRMEMIFPEKEIIRIEESGFSAPALDKPKPKADDKKSGGDDKAPKAPDKKEPEKKEPEKKGPLKF